MERNQDLSAGRMSPALSPATKEKISGRSLKPSSALKNRPPRCLRLVKKAGPTPTIMWETDGQPHTESLMHSGGAVSYTHLDVYKRQDMDGMKSASGMPLLIFFFPLPDITVTVGYGMSMTGGYGGRMREV